MRASEQYWRLPSSPIVRQQHIVSRPICYVNWGSRHSSREDDDVDDADDNVDDVDDDVDDVDVDDED